MIHTHSLAFGLDYVELTWNHPMFLPQRYKLNYLYNKKSTCTASHDMNPSVTTKEQTFNSDTSSVRISDICPNSVCVLILLAVYNPASIDSGIVITGKTLQEDTSKRNLCLNDYMKSSLIIYIHLLLLLYKIYHIYCFCIYESIANIAGRELEL